MNTDASERRLSRLCHECRQEAVRPAHIERTLDVRHDGAQHRVHVPRLPVLRCEHCGAVTYGNDSDEAINRALRDHLALLRPEEIRTSREALGLTQEELGERIGCAGESLSRWENGVVIQSRLYDRMLRAYFHVPELRAFLEELPSNR